MTPPASGDATSQASLDDVTDADDGSDWPFHTAVVDGVEIAGALFDSSTGKFYEFVDPDTHDEYMKYECPRSGETITAGSKIECMMGDILSGRARATVPAGEWADFRADYVDADDDDYDLWVARWEQMAENDPRFDGGVRPDSTDCNFCGESVDAESDAPLGPTCPNCGQPADDPKAFTDNARRGGL